MYIQLGAARPPPQRSLDASSKHLRTNLFVGERMTIDGKWKLRRNRAKGDRSRSVKRSMQLSQSLARPCKHARSRKPPAGGHAESAASRRPLLAGQQEFCSWSTRLGQGRHGEWVSMGAEIDGRDHRCAGTAASAVAAGRQITAVVSWLICCDGLLGGSLRLGDADMRSGSHGMLANTLDLHNLPANLGLGYRCRGANHRRGNGSCRRHEHGEQNQQPEANEFHLIEGKRCCIASRVGSCV